MSRPLEEYALIGDLRTAALVSRYGSIEWLCLPRFDSAACFSALVGEGGNGFWNLAPLAGVKQVKRAYRDQSMVLETTYTCENGECRVLDGMLLDSGGPRIVRHVVGVRGRVPLRMQMKVRFDYGRTIPWVHRRGGAIVAVAGPDAVVLYSDVPMHGANHTTISEFTVGANERVSFDLAYFPSYAVAPGPLAVRDALEKTDAFWRQWAGRCSYNGPYREAVVRSLLTLKALTFGDTGAVVAAPTCSLPEKLGGVRNWDYRYCWLRDATFVLVALLSAGYESEAYAWRGWLLRAVAGAPSKLQILYGIAGERRIPEFEAPWLRGYAGSTPVRIGNAAAGQLQLDVYGEVVDVMYQAHRAGVTPDEDEWSLTRAVVETVERRWREPDCGMWEVRGDPQDFVHSKVLAWVALDRAAKAVEESGLEGPVDRWRALRDEIHDEVCAKGFDTKHDTFVQSYGSKLLDASSLLMPLVGFIAADDPRMLGTVKALEKRLVHDGFLWRYEQRNDKVDGLPPGEGAFLACTYWLCDYYAMAGRRDEAKEIFERLLSIRNDVGLLSEEYDVENKRLVGNFPQAFSHVGLVNAAYNLASSTGPAVQRATGEAIEVG